MTARGGRIRIAVAAAALSLAAPVAADAQAWNYPAFQPPRIATREYNFGTADGDDAGTSLLFQWRQGYGARSQLAFDIGFADPDARDGIFLLAGTFGYQMVRAAADMPLDIMLTAGFGAAVGDENFFRVPVGVALGHRFPLEGQLAITPYIHPRLMMEFCNGCFGLDDSELGIGFDVGANFEFSRQLSMRFAFTMGGTDLWDDNNAFGLSLAWTPMGGTRR